MHTRSSAFGALLASLVLAWLSAAALADAARDQPDTPGVWARYVMERYGVTSCAELLPLLRANVETGHPWSLGRLGLLTGTGDCVAKDYARAAELYERAFALGHSTIGARLGRLYLYGLGVPRDPERARELFRTATLQFVNGDKATRFDFLRKQFFRDTTVPPAVEEAIAWVEGLEHMAPEAQYEPALRYRADTSRFENKYIAYHFMALAGDQGFAKADYQYGHWILADATSHMDIRSGVGFIEEAARGCYLPAQIEMGRRRIRGLGVSSDSLFGHMWLRAAARQGADVSAEMAELADTFEEAWPADFIDEFFGLPQCR